jgi:predicted transglutaminase-like cysteine proteinase
MVLISIYPFTLKRLFFFFLLALLTLSSISAFGQSVYLKVTSTPYDRQMSRITPVLFSKTGSANQNLSLTLVNQWIESLRAIPYGFSPEWKTPAEVEAEPVADCKGKAVALYKKMCAYGAEHVKLVIGKRTAFSRRTHAWLEWNTDTGTYVLDPTINWSACRADKLGDRTYIPLYAYAGTHRYRVTTTALYAKN